MLWYIFLFITSGYFLLIILALLLIPSFVAKPPWHKPRPGKQLTTEKLPPHWTDKTHPDDYNLCYTDVSFPTHSGLTLRGWLIHAQPQKTDQSFPPASPVAVACVHGAGRDRRAFLRHSSFLSQSGYDVLLFDCSNHGTSDCVAAWPLSGWPGRAVSLGKREYLDVISAVEYLSQRGSKTIAILATSQGASSSIVAAAQCNTIDALILENAFESPETLVRHIVHTILCNAHLSILGPLVGLLTWLSLFRTGNIPRCTQRRAIDYVEFVRQPVMFMHGLRDRLVPYEQSKRLHDAAKSEHKRLWLVDRAEHTQCFDVDKVGFETRVRAFLAEFAGKRKECVRRVG